MSVGALRLALRQRWARLRRPALLGTLRRTQPLSDHWGSDRGTPVDRYYIEAFLAARSRDIRGRVLEIKNSAYTERFGCGVTRRDVLDIDAANPRATIVADLGAADGIATSAFDCFILTQTLQFIGDPRCAVAQAWRVLRPGGVLLATVPGLSRVERAYAQKDYWRFTPAACRLLFGAAFGDKHVEVVSSGNVLAATAFLTGMAAEELRRSELDVCDAYYPVVIGVRAVKAGGPAAVVSRLNA
jgi:SAM-dependent methyltransferase